MSTTDEHRFTTDGPVRVKVQLPSADVYLKTSDSGESVVTLEGPQSLIDATTVEFKDNRLNVDWRRKPFMFHLGGSLIVNVEVPAQSTVKLNTASGDATLDGDFGELSINTVSGDASITRVVGDLTMKSVSGDLKIGSVAGSADIKSVSGDLIVSELQAGRLSATSVSGDVRVGVAAGLNLDIDANSVSGDTSSELPLSDAPTDGGDGETVVIRGRTVSGDFRVVHA
jgi:DUF4097 and DUF4098 domain-containing protein YvlB